MKLSRDEDRVNNPIQVEPSVWAWPPELNKIADVEAYLKKEEKREWVPWMKPILAQQRARLDAIADVVLAYKPKPKTKAAKRRKRRAQRAKGE